MNGNFEYDKGSYPYTATKLGDGFKVLHTPTQQEILDQKFPHELAANIALRLNTQYHAAKAGGARFDGSIINVIRLIREEQVASKQRGELAAGQYDQLKQGTYAAMQERYPHFDPKTLG